MAKFVRMRESLSRRLEVIRLASKLRISEREVLGLLYQIASWFDEYGGEYGRIRTWDGIKILDFAFSVEGLGQALIDVEWLVVDGDFLSLRFFCKSSFDRQGISPAIRSQILDGAVCVACGSADQIEIDHVIPVCRGGTSERNNLQPLCFSCNRAKAGRTMEEFLRDR